LPTEHVSQLDDRHDIGVRAKDDDGDGRFDTFDKNFNRAV